MIRSMRTRCALPLAVSIVCAAVSLLAITATVRADYEAAIFRVSNFGGAYECPGTDSVHNQYYTSLFYDRAVGTWNYDYVRPLADHSLNGLVDAKDFTDYSRYSSWGDDLDYDEATDWADTIFLTTHGGTDCMEHNPQYVGGDWKCCGDSSGDCAADYDCNTYNYSQFTMGNSGGDHCSIYTNNQDASHPGNIYFGNTITGQGTGDANIFVTTSCNSINPCVRHYGGYDDMDAGAFNTYLGFYGRHDYHQGGSSAFDNFLASTTNDYIGLEWLAHEYYENEHDNGSYVCPMALIWGSSASNCNYMFDYGGFTDFKDTGTHITKVMYWVEGCDPDDPGYNRTEGNHAPLP